MSYGVRREFDFLSGVRRARANNGRQTSRCARRSPPSVAALFATRTVDNTVDLYAVKSRIALFCLPHLHSTPPLGGYGGFSSEYRYPVWYKKKTRTVGLPDCEKKLKICLFVLTWSTNVTETDRQTDTQTPHDGIGRAYALHRAAKTKIILSAFLYQISSKSDDFRWDMAISWCYVPSRSNLIRHSDRNSEHCLSTLRSFSGPDTSGTPDHLSRWSNC